MVIVSKQMEVPTLEKQLSDYVEGDIVQIPENGVPVEFYVAKHDYESSLNGAGRTLVVRKDTYDNRAWNNTSANTWANCTMRSWLNSTYKALLDSGIQSLMDTTTYYYTPSNWNWNVTTRSDAIFLLSVTELGESGTSINEEGSALPIASTLKIAYRNGAPTTQWTRSAPRYVLNMTFYLSYNGNFDEASPTTAYGSRPVFTLPSTTKFDPDTNTIIG